LGKDNKLQIALVACLATNFLLYRVGLHIVGWHRPCACMGGLTDLLHIPQDVADVIMKFFLLYLLLGSWISFWILTRRPNVARSQMVSS